MEEFVRFEGGFFVGEMKVAIGQGAGASLGDETEFGIVGKERRRCIGGGTGVDDIAANGAAILIGDTSGPACGLGQDGKFLSNEWVFADIGKGGSCAEDDGVGSDVDEAKLFEVPEGDEFSELQT